MKQGWLVKLASVCLWAAAFMSPAFAEKRVALVIGNNDYKNVPKLQKAVNDARTMGDTLKQLGFNVMVAENLNRQQFSQTLLAFDSAVEAGDTAFFFFAGHGFEIAGQNYLLPTDVPAATPPTSLERQPVWPHPPVLSQPRSGRRRRPSGRSRPESACGRCSRPSH